MVPAWDRLFIDDATEEELAEAYADLTDEEKQRLGRMLGGGGFTVEHP